MTEHTATIGGNNPPDLEDLELLEAKVHELLAGANRMVEQIEEIADPATAERVADFDRTQLHPLLKRIEDRRKKEVQPHLDAQRSINAKHKALTEYIEEARKAVKNLLTPWLRKQQEEADRRRREAEEEARKAQQEALRRQAEAKSIEDSVAARQAQEQAERLAKEAAKPQRASVGSAYGARSTSLRSHWRAEITDIKKAAAYYARKNDPRLLDALLWMASQDVRALAEKADGTEAFPGVTARREQKAA